MCFNCCPYKIFSLFLFLSLISLGRKESFLCRIEWQCSTSERSPQERRNRHSLQRWCGIEPPTIITVYSVLWIDKNVVYLLLRCMFCKYRIILYYCRRPNIICRPYNGSWYSYIHLTVLLWICDYYVEMNRNSFPLRQLLYRFMLYTMYRACCIDSCVIDSFYNVYATVQ